MTKIWLPDTVPDIEDWTFDECGQLYKLYMHSGTKISGERVFDRCRELNDIIRYDYMRNRQMGTLNGLRGSALSVRISNAIKCGKRLYEGQEEEKRR